MKHLVIIDGHHLMYRAFYAIPATMRTSKGEQVNTVFGVASMLLQILRIEQLDQILFCFDAAEETFRHTEYKEYKMGRAETPQSFYDQIPRVFALLDAFNIKNVSGMKFEADDFAGTYALLASKAGGRVTIVSGDRDLLQLASDTVRIAIPYKAYQAPEYFDPQKVFKKYGVTPEQIPSYKALVGDPSDNLKGVTGIGPVAAAKLLSVYGSLDGIYHHLQDIKPVWRAKLEPQMEHAFFCKRMSELVCTIEPPVSLDDLTIPPFDLQRIQAFFSELEFSLLRKRLDQFIASEAGKKYAPVGRGLFIEPTKSERKEENEATQLSLL